jgi:hypothetical protein
MHIVHQVLIIGVGVDSGHQAVLDTDRFMQDFGQWRQTVGCAGSIRYDGIRCQQLVIIDAENECTIDILIARGGNDDFFGPACQVRRSFGFRSE